MTFQRRHFLATIAGTAGAGLLPRLLAADAPVATYLNPIIKGDYPDPTVLRVDGMYYMTHSANTYCPAFLIWKSPNLVDWQPVDCALKEYDGDLWAPDLAYHDGKFYLYYTTTGKNCVMVADKVEGPWSKPIDLKISNIDPGHIATPEGKRYLHVSGGHAIELAADGLSTVGKLEQVFEPWPIPPDWRVECVCLESPKLFFRDGWYHLLVAQGGTGGPPTSHMAIHARSKTPLGPWEYSPHNPIVHTESRKETWWSKGHATAVEVTDGSWWLVYHAYEGDYYTLGRTTMMEPLEWTGDGWFQVKKGILTDGPIPRPPGKPQPFTIEHSDTFPGDKLNPLWRFWKEDGIGAHQVSDHRLTLDARGSTMEKARFLTRITGDHAYRIEVEVEVDEGTEGGLLLFYNPTNFIGLGLDGEGVGTYIRGERGNPGDAANFKSRRATLRITNVNHDVSLAILPDGGKWINVYTTYETSGYHHNVFGGFLDLRPALFAKGKGAVRFRELKYEVLA